MNGDWQRLLCVILPALNEEATIADVIEQIPRAMPGISHIDVLVVDDGSSDNTVDVSRKAGATVIEHGTNLGLGVAIASGIDAALSRGADTLVHLDSDGQFAAADIPKLVRVIDKEASVSSPAHGMPYRS